MTKVINLFGGASSGKSTCAFGLCHQLKLRGINVEYVNEYIKTWAYKDHKPNEYDQVYIFGKQAKKEYDLYGKVDYIVSDSPLLLSAIYEEVIQGESVVKPSVFNHIQRAKSNGIEFHNFYLKRCKGFNPVGRWGSEDEARQMDKYIQNFLTTHDVDYTFIEEDDYRRVDKILSHMLVSH
jgi:nicotinamide riboside kinase